jgi:UDP-N-acetylmuramoyl-tripeptide--D-alanyl-D-alanine ligase
MISFSHLKNCPSIIEHNYSNLMGSAHFYTDTRKFTERGAFVAIPGAKVNVLNLIEPLLEKGCPLVVYEGIGHNVEIVQKLQTRFPQTDFTPVKDSVTFLQELTHSHIVEWQKRDQRNTVFAISGSNGKTTHKEMLSHIMKTILPGKVVATEKNNNNHLGVPLTLLNVTNDTQFVILELGSNHPGEIKVLCDIAEPNAGLTTNIGATHLEFFGTEEAVFEEEAYLYHAVKAGTGGRGFFLINKDDPYLTNLPDTEGSVAYGETGKAKISYLDNGGQIGDLRAQNDFITGRHNKLNLITCAFIANHFYPEKKAEILRAASEFRPTKNRSEWINFEGRPVFLDAYNANPSSMRAALQGFKESVLTQGIKLADTCVVLGDMNELGHNAPKYHQEVGQYINELGLPNVYFVGRYADHYLRGFSKGNKRASTPEFKQEYRSSCIKKFSIHFIKGSRSLQLESLFDIT